MKRKGQYPLPVLGVSSNGYSNLSEFSINCTNIQNLRFENGKASFIINFVLRDDKLNELIENGTAMFVIHLECPQTSERLIYLTNEATYSVEIKEGRIYGKFDVSAAVVLMKDLNHFTNESWSEFFKGIVYHLEKGHILAYHFVGSFYANEKEEEKKVKSIIAISYSNGNETNIVLNSNYIMVALPKKTWNLYEQIGPYYPSTNNAQLNFPIIMEAFSAVIQDPEQFVDYRWFFVLSVALEKAKYSMEDVINGQLSPFKAADLVLKQPLYLALKEQEHIFRRIEDDATLETVD